MISLESLQTQINALKEEQSQLKPILKDMSEILQGVKQANVTLATSIEGFKGMYKEAVPIGLVYRLFIFCLLIVSLIEGIKWGFTSLIPGIVS